MSAESQSPALNVLEIQTSTSSIDALARCDRAFRETRKATLVKTRSEFTANNKASRAYKNELPPLIGAGNIRDFIACVAHGMLLGAIDDNQASRLLYAARTAQSILRDERKPSLQPDSPAIIA